MVNIYSENQQINDIDTIIWDKDGTFVDQHAYWGEVAIKRVEKTFQLYNIDEKFKEQMIFDLGYDRKINRLTDNSPIAIFSRPKVIDFFQNSLKKISYEISTEEIDKIFIEVHKEIEQNLENYIYPFEEAINLIKLFNKVGLTQILITSDGKENTLKTLKYLGLEKYFTLVAGKEDCDEPKETGKVLRKIINDLKIDPKKTISIGDTKSDWEMGFNAGIKGSILVPTGQVTLKELKKYSDFCVNNLSEIYL